MAIFTVTTTSDSGAGSLRQAVLDAAAIAGADEIRFDAAVFDGEAADVIRLTGGQIEITDGLTIAGGPAGVTATGDASGADVTLAGGITDVDASGAARLDDNSRIFSATAALTLDGLTLTGGRTTGFSQAGGAVRGTTVTLTNSTVSGNSTAGGASEGGGVWGYSVTLTNSTVSGNSTAGDYSRGGGVWGGDVAMTTSTVSGNSTAGDGSEGGGVWGFNGVALMNSTASGNNTAGDYSRGGGVWGGDVAITNSTVSGNSTAGNDSGGGGVYGSRGTLTNSVVLGNATISAGADEIEVDGALTLAGGNILGGDLFDGEADVGDVTVSEVFAATTEIAPGVLAGVLADNGGPTRTILIEAGGPAVDAGGVATLPIDQRGLERVVGAAVDLGAVEIGAGPTEERSMVVTTALDVVANDGLTSLREAAFFANFERGTDTITFDAWVFDGEACDVIRLTRGQIDVTESRTIEGGPAGVTITGDANGDDVALAGGITDVAASLVGEDRLDDNSRIFDATTALTLDGLTLTGGRTMADFESGGAVRGGTVTLTNSTVSGNSTAGWSSFGGGVSGLAVTLTNSTVSGNSTAGYSSDGGGIRGGDVTLIDSTVSGNSTAGFNSNGGGIRSSGNVTLIDSTVSGNSTAGSGSGGGVWGGDVTLIDSTVSGNSTAGYYSGGGGVRGVGVTLTNSTVSDNSTAGDRAYGGGVYGSDVTMTNSTISGNSTAGNYSLGGGVWGRDVALTNSTVSGNSTSGDGSEGGGLYGAFGGGVTLTNSIVLGNATIFAGVDGDEIDGGLTRTGGNILGGDLFDGDADVGDVTSAEVFAATIEIAPGVGAGVLADNGGPTRTILIAADGPAVDAGGATALPIDQRGLERVFGDEVDLGAVELGAGPAEPGSLVVTTARDVVANDGLTSLREAAFFANLELGTDTIAFDASVFDGEAGDVIRLTGGQIGITEALAIEGGAAGVTITGDANGDDVTLAGGITDVAASLVGEDFLDDNSRIFDATADLTLDGLTLTGGRTMAESEDGGAVRGTTVTLIDSTVNGNSTAGDGSRGGGVSGGYGYVTLTNSTVSGNSTAGGSSEGGGVSGFYVALIDSTVSGNSTAGYSSDGGGVHGSDVALIDSTVSGNSTAGDRSDGGGVRGYGEVTLTNSTISGNSTAGNNSYGGGVYSYGVTLTNSTVSGNRTAGDNSYGGGIWSFGGVTLTDSIVLGNATVFAGVDGDEVGGSLTLTGGNILGPDILDGAADTGDVTAEEVFAATTEIAPSVFGGVLADNGGPTQTIAIRADGPAAAAADPATALATDQRGFARDDAPDLGAFEAGAEDGLKLVGGPGADVLVGGAGDDRICGRGGDDLLRGLAGDDLLRGGRGCDQLKGGAAEDDLAGGRGRDRIGGGTGDDTLGGGEGCDVFVFGQAFGDDAIRDFDADPRRGQDRIDLRALGISAASFATSVSIERLGDDTLVTLGAHGSILCSGIDGEGANRISQADFLLLA